MSLILQTGFAQKTATPANTAEKTRQTLAANARALESRGRPDMAIQIWQQILLSDPKNAEALAGLARDYKLSGSAKESDNALEKLRTINPNDPNIGKIQSLSTSRVQNDDLRRAGELARQGHNEDAMKIYRQLYADRPPEGDIALAYYQTLYGTATGKEQAIGAMRALAQKNPGDSRYSVELGRMLTYDPRTRTEGIRLLEEHPLDPAARSALRQALIWDSANPASAAELRKYMQAHPQDAELASRLKENESKLAEMNSGIARTPEERAAFAALNAKRLDEAEKRFQELLEKDPNNGRVAAGMGFLRMQQQNFGGAVSYLTQAEQNGYKTAVVENALATSRFWYTMGEATQAFDANQLDVAAQKYQEALAMKPKSPEALNGLAGLYIKEQQYQQAAGVYQDLLKSQPSNADAWRGLFLAYARDGQNEKALATAAKFPARIKTEMAKDPEYLRTLATIYKAEGRPIEAQKVLSQALALPFPDNGANLKQGTRLQYAGILMEASRFDQAAAIYTQILNDDANSLPAWMGLVSAHHELGQDTAAIGDVEKMPPSVYESALSDSGFLTMLGSIYQQANQPDVAQTLLERSVKVQQAQGAQPSVQLQLQLAGIYLQRGNTDQAYAIYRQVLTANPERADAWKGLISTLQATDHSTEALQQLVYIPPSVRKELETDPQFVQTVASIYATAGDIPHATEYMARVQRYYAQQGTAMPSDTAIQNAWLLYNTKNDRALYPELMRLGSRPDLTAAQRETVQTIWASWAVRRAGAAMDNGDNQRAVEILEAASQAFPENVQVKRILAGGYLRTGQTRASLALYKSLPMQDAGVNDFQGAIGAALAANDKVQAEAWLRQALERFPHDYKILGMAARYEQARGDAQRSADYWRAAIAAMPAGSPTDKLAHELAYPDQNTKAQKARSNADLQQLLNPDNAAMNDPFQKTVKLPPLPSYGPDPYLGTAPVILQPQQAAVRPNDIPTAPPVTQAPVTQAPIVQVPATEPTPTPRTTTHRGSAPLPAPKQGTQPSTNHKKPTTGTSGPGGYTGRMNIPEEHITVPEPRPAQSPTPSYTPSYTAPPQQPADQNRPVLPVPSTGDKPKVYIPAPQSSIAPNAGSQPAYRLSTPSTGDKASQAQALFAQQTDSQLTPGSDQQIRQLGNVPLTLPGDAPHPSETSSAVATVRPAMSGIQYTPSAQEAATGAYSAQQPKQAPPEPQPRKQQQAPPPPPPASTAQPEQQQPKKHQKHSAKTAQETVPTLVTAPTEAAPLPPPPGVDQTQQPQPAQQQPAAPDTSAPGGLTDEQLQDRNLPPLRGPWVKVQRQPKVISPREEAEQQLQSLESSYSAWLAGTGIINYRSGDLGYSRLSAFEVPFEWSAPVGYHGRISVIAKPVFLDSGQADGTSVITVQELTSGARTLVTIPQPLGTMTNTGPTAGTTFTGAPPAQQNATGLSPEIQLTTPTFAAAGGYTPLGFLVANWTARASWRPGNGPITFSFTRDSIKDSQLSYGGLRDPGTSSLSYPGTIWGGVVGTGGNVQYVHGDAISGFYLGGGGQYINGYNTQTNYRVDGNGGAYWRVKAFPEFGSLSIGTNFFAMHYKNNQGAFTFGMGGYFSPQAYFLANVPVTWAGHYQTRWHYQIVGGLGVQAFQTDLTPLYPLPEQKPILIGLNNASLPATTSIGANYDIRANGAYQVSPHWFIEGFASGNNARNYNAATAGFSIHYMFRAQPSTVTAPTGLFPHDGIRPFTVP
ncbi:cellulose synthase subunit BcsC-related outer membrane protein [Occallatibacter riparius]|uniref:Cellulose synthase subunit BcsC-related outer membrane protein n=1 Tax=Occallatibacter riparius TaxID=1002689 RepID=A0A9J7BKB9_9BACT|nr:cellulose synthase subunit BcsC-related outer membrane protein [Occallatibacter riparius]UWZ83027.1 cellulose synthase subunit BcsC-related outer membrane protein [Occallatibacter riparius]